MTLAEIDALERIADRAWLAAERATLGQWLLNAADGWSGRLNACWPLGEPEVGLEPAVEAVEAWYRARGLKPQFKPAGAVKALEALLTRRGYRLHTPTQMMISVIGEVTGPARVRVAADADAAFETVFLGAQDNAADAAERIAAFRRTPRPRVFATVELDSAPVAIGGCAVEGDWAGIFGMRTLAGHRRQGLARDIVAALLAGAKAAGASRAYLQVESPNSPAIALYEGFGFRLAYRYRYWTLD